MPDSSAQPGVRAQVAPLAVDRHEVARLDHVEQVQQLAGRRVAGDVHLGDVLVDDEGAGPGQLVDHPVDRGLVAGHQRAGQHDGVAGRDRDVPVVADRHPAQRAHRLALRPGRHRARSRPAAACVASSRPTTSPAGMRSRPRSRAMPMLRTIERPMKATLRPCACAASSTCCTRCTCEAKRGHDDRARSPSRRSSRAPGRSRAPA